VKTAEFTVKFRLPKGKTVTYPPTPLPRQGTQFIFFMFRLPTLSEADYNGVRCSDDQWIKNWKRCGLIVVVMTVSVGQLVCRLNQGRPKGRAIRATALGATLKERWNNRKYGSSKFSFPHAKEMLRKVYAIWARCLKKVRQRRTRPKKYKEYQS